MFSRTSLIRSGLRQHWRIHLAVGLGVAAATAVLTGALVVGDSVRGSLRHLALDRLGLIHTVVIADRFFRESIAENYAREVPAIILQATVENVGEHKARAGNVTVIGDTDGTFWSLGTGGPAAPPSTNEIVLNQPLADELQARVGDDVILRIGQSSQIPADSPLGRKTDAIRNRRLKVSAIIPAQGLGRFGLRPNQQLPLNAYVATEMLQAALEQPDKVNAIFVVSPIVNPCADIASHASLADLGLQLTETPQDYFNFTSTRMLLEPAAERAVEESLAGATQQTALTYLANYLKVGDGKAKIPYSTVTAIDVVDKPPFGPFTSADGKTIEPLADDEIVLNRWAADDFAKQGVEVKPGDEVTLEFFEPESTHGEVRERTATFKLKAIAQMTPIVADRNFTPELPGVTDQKSISNWNPPFPYDDTRVRSIKPHDEDEAYWDEYKATPKAFISLAAGRKLWASRFGDATSVRILPPEGMSRDDVERQLLAQLKPEELGFQALPVRDWAFAASRGTTPFNALFMGFSFLIVASAVMLIALLFRLGVEQQASEIGVLLAVGMRLRRVAGLLVGEAAVVTLIAAAFGTLLGVAYGWLLLVGLQTWWLEAIRTPFLQLYVTWPSLAIGFASGVVVSMVTIVFTLWRMRQVAVRRLLAGVSEEPAAAGSRRSAWPRRIGWTLGATAIAVAAFGQRLSGDAQAGAFFGCGALVLAASLLLLIDRLRREAPGNFATSGKLAIARLAARNASRNPRRSALTIGLVAVASFLIVAMSAFRLDPAAQGIGTDSGSGRFALIAESSHPILKDLNSHEGRADLGFSGKDEIAAAAAQTFALRVQPGDDASCLNLYQTSQPRSIGVPQSLIKRGGFAWSSTLATTSAEKANPWLLLDAEQQVVNDELQVPVVLDANTATYNLKVGVGDTLNLLDGRNRPFKARVVGLLKNSIFQGDLLMSEAAFLKLFPDVNGYRQFLVEAPVDATAAVQSAFETALGDYGFDAERTSDRLASFFAVQNTYLSTFQSLGGLGLLLGTFGLAAVQLRSVIERRGELALLRAAGFRSDQLRRLVLYENALLLIGGLAVGVGSAAIAVLPYWLSGNASVPWQSLAATLFAVLAAGLIAAALVVRGALRTPLIPALRGD